MTCIVALIDKGNVYIGGDSAGVAGNFITIRKDEKVFINGDCIMGFTSSFRMGNLLQYKFVPPQQKAKQSDIKYLNTDFIDAVKKTFKENDFGKPDEGGSFLLGYRGKLYNISADFQVGIPMLDFDAVGCGADIALGAMYVSSGDPKKRIIKALEASATFSTGVAAPFRVLKLPKK